MYLCMIAFVQIIDIARQHTFLDIISKGFFFRTIFPFDDPAPSTINLLPVPLHNVGVQIFWFVEEPLYWEKKALGIECIHEKLNRVYLTYILCWGALFQISWIVQDQALKSNQFRVSAQIFVFQNSWISQDRILKSNQVTMISIRGEIPRQCTKHPCHSASPTFFVEIR